MDKYLSTINFRDMNSKNKLLFRIGIDITCLLLVGIPLLIFYYGVKPYRRGFFCSDLSLYYPFKDSTVTSTTLYTVGTFVPVIAMVVIELVGQVRLQQGGRPALVPSHRVRVKGVKVPRPAVRLYRVLGWFLLGAAVQQLATDIAKYSVGRLRPHFIQVCRPIVLGTSNNYPILSPDHPSCGPGHYIEDFVCTSTASSQRLKEIRLSFPSGHSSFAFYTMTFLAVYLYHRRARLHHQLAAPVLQALCVGAAWFTALSRVSDYKHHPTDVLAGAAIGLVVLLAIVKLGSPFKDSPPSSEEEPTLPTANNGNLPEVVPPETAI